jgi:hypothetical protein
MFLLISGIGIGFLIGLYLDEIESIVHDVAEYLVSKYVGKENNKIYYMTCTKCNSKQESTVFSCSECGNIKFYTDR